MPTQLGDLPTELCYYISLHVAEPTALSLTNHYFHGMVTAPDFLATHLLFRYGRAHALFVAIRDHPFQLTPAVIKYLRAKGAILPCILVQNLDHGLRELQKEKDIVLEEMEAERINNILLEELRATIYGLEGQREEDEGQILRKDGRVNWLSNSNTDPNTLGEEAYENLEMYEDDYENYYDDDLDPHYLIAVYGSESGESESNSYDDEDDEDGEFDFDDDGGCTFPMLSIGENLSKPTCDAIFEWGRDLYDTSCICNSYDDFDLASHWDDDQLLDIIAEYTHHPAPIPREFNDEVKAKVLKFIISKNYLPLPFSDPTVRKHTDQRFPSIKDTQSNDLSIPEGANSRLKSRKAIETGPEMEDAELQYGDDFQVLVGLLRYFPDIVEEQLVRHMGFDFEQLDIDLFLFSALQCVDLDPEDGIEIVTIGFENMMKIAPNIRPSKQLICCILSLADEYEHDMIDIIVNTLQRYAPPEIDFTELAKLAANQRRSGQFELDDTLFELGLLN